MARKTDKEDLRDGTKGLQSRSPLRQQYENIKAKFPDGILLFRLGDFYETFDDDAVLLSRDLDITLTSKELGKADRVPLAGIPVSTLNSSISKLLDKGHKVAICEQMESDTKPGTLINREIVRIVTPGTILEEDLLPGRSNNFLVSLVVQANRVGLACIDISTSEFKTLELDITDLPGELDRLNPAEIIVADPDPFQISIDGFDDKLSVVSDRWYDLRIARAALIEHFSVRDLQPYGCENMDLATIAAGSIVLYLQETQSIFVNQIRSLSTISFENTMILDSQTVKTLELFQGIGTGNKKGSLLELLDITKTPMGSRLLRNWLGHPLLKKDDIDSRSRMVQWFYTSFMHRATIRSELGNVADLERLTNRVAAKIATPRDLLAIHRSLISIGKLSKEMAFGDDEDLAINTVKGTVNGWKSDAVLDYSDLIQTLGHAIVEDPPIKIGEGQLIDWGFSHELDILRERAEEYVESILKIEKEERDRTQINSLKIGHSRVFGYFIEVTKSNLSKVPDNYIRKQTIANGERYFIPLLKEIEDELNQVREEIERMEYQLFSELLEIINAESYEILKTSAAIGKLDVISSFAESASLNNYKPAVFVDERELKIEFGRHPVVEHFTSSSFVPNNTSLSEQIPISVVTGPNMSGKSTYLRQVAIIAIMAQIGSWVPAQKLTMGIIDRVFTRAGLQDDISQGRSTFMVEMIETAYILHHATPNSLIILDEIGRGTSTYDGLSIAWAVIEHIHNADELKSRTLFATHYHELIPIVDLMDGASNLHVSVSEENGKIIFLHSIVEGGINRSYGLHVAQIAGIPKTVVERGQELLKILEGRSVVEDLGSSSYQPSLFKVAKDLSKGERKALDLISKVVTEEMTPLQALNFLNEIKLTIDSID